MTTLVILLITLIITGLIVYLFKFRFRKTAASKNSRLYNLEVSPNFFCPDASCFVNIRYKIANKDTKDVKLSLFDDNGNETILSTEKEFHKRYESKEELFAKGSGSFIVTLFAEGKKVMQKPLQILKPGVNTIRHVAEVYLESDQPYNRQFATDRLIFAELTTGKDVEYTFCTHDAVLTGVTYRKHDPDSLARQLRLNIRRKSEQLINLGDMNPGDSRDLDSIRIDQGVEIEATIFSNEPFTNKSTTRWILDFDVKCLHDEK